MKTAGSRKTIIAVGDIMPDSRLAEVIIKKGIDQKRSELTDLLKNGDVVVGNLECPLTDREQVRSGQLWNLRMPTVLAPLLSVFDAGK